MGGGGRERREGEKECCAVDVAYVSLRTFSILRTTKDISVRASTVTAVIRLRCRVKKVRALLFGIRYEQYGGPSYAGVVGATK